jgi:hypothetical protein
VDVSATDVNPFPDAEPEGFLAAIRRGPFSFRPAARAGVAYDSNIFISHSNAVSDEILSLAPTLRVKSDRFDDAGGAVIDLGYTPEFIAFVHNSDNDSVDHHFAGGVGWELARLDCTVEHHYDATSGAVVDAGRRLRQGINHTEVEAAYRVGEKLSLGTSLHRVLTDNEGAISSSEWRGDLRANYDFTPKLTLGLGARAGTLDVASQGAQVFEQALTLARYTVTGRVRLDAETGVEIRQFGSARSDLANWVFRVAMDYLVSPKTAVTLGASRATYSSAVLAGQDYNLTGVTLELNKELAAKLNARLNLGYNFVDYVPTTSAVTATREDSFYLLRAALLYHPAVHWEASAFVQFRRNDSNSVLNSFDNTSTGVSIAYTY